MMIFVSLFGLAIALATGLLANLRWRKAFIQFCVRNLRSLAPHVSSFISISGVTALLFIGVNIAAMIALNKSPEQILKPEPSVLDVAITPQSEKGQAILVEALGQDAAHRIKESFLGMPNPYFAMHPTLHYVMAKVNNPFIHIGVEGVRYLTGWSDEDVRARLHGRERPLILLLGGSTTLGHGLRDDETIASYLQQMVEEGADVLNLGAGAYDQIREIDRLEYLLRQGVRPTAVIFLDGDNDIIDIARSNYRWNDKIVYHGMVSGRGDVSKPDNAFNISTSASVRPADFAVMISKSTPVTRYISEKIRPKLSLDDIKDHVRAEIDPFLDMPFSYQQQEFLYGHWAWFGDQNLELLKREIVDYYKHNVDYIIGLSNAFHFTPILFYQPNGQADPNNLFNGTGGEKLPGFLYLHEMHNLIRSEIQAGRLKMVDLNGCLDDLSVKHMAYIDPQHYTPLGDKRIAEMYLRRLTESGVLRQRPN